MTRKRIGFVLIALLLVAAVVVIMTMLSRTSDTPLDPHNPKPLGAEAVATVLGEQGVHVRTVDNVKDVGKVKAGSDVTVLVSMPSQISTDRLREIARMHAGSARLILIGPDAEQVSDAFDVSVRESVAFSPVPAGDSCHLTWGRGLTVPSGSLLYSVAPGVGTCFTEGGYGAAIELAATADHPPVLIIGTPEVYTNKQIRHDDNAAFALRSLGQTSELVWYSGGYDAGSPAANQPSVLPKWIKPSLWLLLICVILLMFARGRRLGRLVQEPLPVIVHANETTAARGQLYRKARDTPRTAAVLRAATRGRLRTFLGLPASTPDDALAHAVATNTGRDPRQVASVLIDDATPYDEATLTQLAQELSTLERQVRR